MGGEGIKLSAGFANDDVPEDLLEPLREVLSRSDEPGRYRLIASLLMEVAGHAKTSGNNRALSAEQVEGLTKKLQLAQEEKASINDTLSATRADLAHRVKQLESEQARATELQRIIDDQRGRLDGLQKETTEKETQLAARISDLDRSEGEKERLLLKLQRAEKALGDQTKVDRLEEKRGELSAQIERLQAETAQLRTDKDAEIERLTAELRRSQAGATQGADELLAALWDRLARTKPPLAEGHVPPNPQAAERLVDAFIELVHFVDGFDKSMRVFLSKYTKHHPTVKVPWEVYAKSDDLHKTAFQTVAPKGRPVALLKMRLKVLQQWIEAAMIGCDSAIESIASELQTHLMGQAGIGSDPARKIKDFLRDDGHYVFLEHMRELRSLKLAETYGRGG